MNDERRLTQFGIASMLPGLRAAIDVLEDLRMKYQRMLGEIEEQIGEPPKRGSATDKRAYSQRLGISAGECSENLLGKNDTGAALKGDEAAGAGSGGQGEADKRDRNVTGGEAA